jgi:hypothetical protein
MKDWTAWLVVCAAWLTPGTIDRRSSQRLAAIEQIVADRGRRASGSATIRNVWATVVSDQQPTRLGFFSKTASPLFSPKAERTGGRTMGAHFLDDSVGIACNRSRRHLLPPASTSTRDSARTTAGSPPPVGAGFLVAVAVIGRSRWWWQLRLPGHASRHAVGARQHKSQRRIREFSPRPCTRRAKSRSSACNTSVEIYDPARAGKPT